MSMADYFHIAHTHYLGDVFTLTINHNAYDIFYFITKFLFNNYLYQIFKEFKEKVSVCMFIHI